MASDKTVNLFDASQPLPADCAYFALASIQESIYYLLFAGLCLGWLAMLQLPVPFWMLTLILLPVPLGLWLLMRGLQQLQILWQQRHQRFGVLVEPEILWIRQTPGPPLALSREAVITVEHRKRRGTSSSTVTEHQMTLYWQDPVQTSKTYKVILSSLKFQEPPDQFLHESLKRWAKDKFKTI